MIDAVAGTTCQGCGGRLRSDDAGAYVCNDCGESYEITDMFMP